MRRILIAVAALLGAAVAASAATVPYRSDGELVAISDRVVRARVLDSIVERAPSGAIRTRTRVVVIEDFTGGADAILTVNERGGRLADGTSLWIPGTPRFAPGDDVVLCLERTDDGYRTVSMAFSAFRVQPAAAGGRYLVRFGGTTVVGGRTFGAVEASRSLDEFRRAAASATGVAARVVLTEADAGAAVAAARGRVDEPFTLLGSGFRWREADSGQPITWYRNTVRPSTVQGADTDTEIAVALSAWTAPPAAVITLAFGGTRLDSMDAQPDPYCSAVNLGAGLITFGDPLDDLAPGVLAIGGGCASATTHVVNGRTFNAFTHGLVVMNDDAALAGFRTVPNITRILEHEVGHAIGLGHTDLGPDNIMYPSCCAAAMPVPPAIGPDDLAGLVFIYPAAAPPCTYTASPQTTNVGPIGGERIIGVTSSRPDCAWTVASNAPWIIPTEGTSGVGNGSVRLSVVPNIGSQAQRSGTLSIATATATVVQAADADGDADGLPDSWETFFGLNPAAAGGADGPAGDPDNDGVTNAGERAAGTHPRGTFRRYLAEGAANAFFDTEIALFGPLGFPTAVLLRLQPESGPEVAWPVRLPTWNRGTVLSSIFKALTPGSFGIVIESDQPVVVDRTMRWDASGYGSHTESALEATSTTWYLAEGSTSGDFALFYLLQNPGNAAASVTVRFLRPAPQPPVERTYALAPHARLTIPVDAVAPELASTDVSGVITATQPIIVERAMYLSRPGQPFAAGHESAGVTTPGTEWFLAEGATGSFFDLFVLIENPGTQDATVEVQYLRQAGPPLVKQYLVRAQSRFTIYVDDEQLPAGSGQRPLAATSMSMRVRATNGAPIIVERAMWWGQPGWYEAHNAPATNVTGAQWITAAGYAGGPNNAETYILIANTDTVPVDAVVFVYFETGAETLSTFLTLPPQSRTSVPIGATFPQALGRRFSIQVAGGGSPGPLVVERATYESPGGVTWAAGGAAGATPLVPTPKLHELDGDSRRCWQEHPGDSLERLARGGEIDARLHALEGRELGRVAQELLEVEAEDRHA